MEKVIHAHKIKVVTIRKDINGERVQAPVKTPSPENKTDVFLDNMNPPTSGRTVLLGGAAESGKTVLLKNMIGAAIASLTRVSNGEKVQVKDSVFKIGKEKSYVNYCVTGNPTISRNHAQIEYVDDTYYLVDMNSTNHSFLGDDPTQLEPEKRYPLKNGDHFKLSNEEFIFELK